VDGVDVGVGAELEADRQRVAAVIAADGFHVDRLVDADDLRLDRLRDGAFHRLGRGAGIGGGDGDLRRHDVGELRDRDARHRQQAGDGDHDRDHHREPRPVDEDGGDHRAVLPAPAGAPLPTVPLPAVAVCAAGDPLPAVPLSTALDVGPPPPVASAAVTPGWGEAGPGITSIPGRTRCTPSTTTIWPSCRPLVTTAVVGEDWPIVMRVCCALFYASTVKT